MSIKLVLVQAIVQVGAEEHMPQIEVACMCNFSSIGRGLILLKTERVEILVYACLRAF